jgi:lysophospholipase L1-like esterase
MSIDRRTLLRAAVGGVTLGATGLAAPAMAASGPHHPTVFVAGDSTAATYATTDVPQAGWGQALSAFLRPEISLVNEAAPGRSSKSFYDEGRLDRILTAIGPGDVLVISFGHNDEKSDDPTRYTEPWTTFQDYLRLYLDGARAARALPILATPVERRRFKSDGTPYLSHGEYPDAMRALATEARTPLVDLSALSFALWSELGPDATKDYFLWLDAGEWPNFSDGISDNTHFQAHGAIELARLVVQNACELPGRDQRALRNPSIPDDVLIWPATRPSAS